MLTKSEKYQLQVGCSRMNFNQAEEEYIDGEDTIGLGTLGKEGSGRYGWTANITAGFSNTCAVPV